jgi:hypothetical protein
MNEQASLWQDEIEYETAHDTPERALSLPTPQAGARLVSVEMWNFKRARHCRIVLPEMAILTGVNNSGKTTVLHAICLAFEVLRDCFDPQAKHLIKTGRSKKDLETVPANVPRDLWYARSWYTGKQHVPIRVRLEFDNGYFFEVLVRLLYGFLNARIVDCAGYEDAGRIDEVLALDPVYVSGNLGVQPHEELLTRAVLTKRTAYGLVSQFIRNILTNVGAEQERFASIAAILNRWLGLELVPTPLDPETDVELRSEYREGDLQLDVISCGSGMHQLLQVAAFLYYRAGRLLLLDEPDAHLHHTLQGQLLGLLRDLASELNVQVIMATHSPALMASADLGQIVPIDFGHEELGPVRAHEDVLGELERLTGLTNFTLAILYQSRRCLFVEGETDETLIPRIAERLGSNVFKGPRPVVLFPYGGSSKIAYVREVVELCERLVGSSIEYLVARDRDWLTDGAVQRIERKAEESGFSDKLLVLPTFDASNMALSRECIVRTIAELAASRGLEPLPEADVLRLCDSVCTKVLSDTQHTYVTENQTLYVTYAEGEETTASLRSEAAHDAMALVEEIRAMSLPERLRRLDGKRIVATLSSELQRGTGLNLRMEDLLMRVTESDVPPQVIDLLNRLASS